MSDSSVKELSKRIGLPVKELLVQLHQAGVSASAPSDVITGAEELKLLEYIRLQKAAKNGKKGKITLKRKTTSEVRQQGGKTISVEVRKKRTFVRRKPNASASAETSVKKKTAKAAKKQVKSSTTVPPSRTEALLKQLEAESRAREAAALNASKKAKTEEKETAVVVAELDTKAAVNDSEVIESKAEKKAEVVRVESSESTVSASVKDDSPKNIRKNVAILPQSKEDKVTNATVTPTAEVKTVADTAKVSKPVNAQINVATNTIVTAAETDTESSKPVSSDVQTAESQAKVELPTLEKSSVDGQADNKQDKAEKVPVTSAVQKKTEGVDEQSVSTSVKKAESANKPAKRSQQAKPARAKASKTVAKPAKKPTSTIDSKQEQQKVADQVAVKTDKTKPSSQDAAEPKTQAEKTRDLFAKARAQREAVAKAARREAAALLKRRPSPKVVKKAKVEKKKVEAKKADEEKVVKAAQAKSTEAQKKTAKPEAKAKDAKSTKAKKPSRRKVAGTAGDVTTFEKRRKQDANDGAESGRKRRKKRRKDRRAAAPQPQIERKHSFEKPTAPVVREIEIPETIVVSDLALALAVKATEVIKVMMGMGVMATINQSIDQDTATLVVEELGHTAKSVTHDKEEVALSSINEDFSEYDKKSRPPVVTIMGHVDHGKTSLLDYIRNSRVAAGEAGGITQHIGAYHVDTEHGTVSFLDTPGHAAFTAMRARGTQVTDIVILIVAADDGVMPTTLEAIQHTRAAGVPMIVAVNKIDKADADPERVRSELSQHEVIPEDWGGEEVFVNISAKTGEGIDELLESILLVAEVLELEARDEGPAKGMVVESGMEKGRGAVATVLVQEGELRKGDTILCGREFGRIRAMFNEKGRSVKLAGPSIPVQVTGLSGVPIAGDEVLVIADERKAREIAEIRSQEARDNKLATQQAAKLDRLFENMKEGEKSVVNLLIKADVQGSVEALRETLVKLSTDEVEVNVVSTGVGGINEGDVNLALASQAILIGFNVRAEAPARKLIGDTGVDLRYYSVIYDIMDDVKQAMSGLLSPELREEIIGTATVKDVFRSSSFGTVAGCLVVEGVVKRGNPIRVLRDNVVIYEGELESLRRHRDDVNEVRMGTECGIAVKNYNDVKVGDQIEVYERVEVQRVIH